MSLSIFELCKTDRSNNAHARAPSCRTGCRRRRASCRAPLAPLSALWGTLAFAVVEPRGSVWPVGRAGTAATS
eukprot:11766449-Alexandrium_andersonii.AAC.1